MSNQITQVTVERYGIVVPDTNPDYADCREFDEHLSSTWEGNFWVVAGHNAWTNSLIVYPYMVEPLRDLLAALPKRDV
jgi:hypothetical protein